MTEFERGYSQGKADLLSALNRAVGQENFSPAEKDAAMFVLRAVIREALEYMAEVKK